MESKSLFQKLTSLVGLAALPILLSSCSPITAPTVPYVAFTYSEVSAPMDIEFNNTRIGPSRGKAETVTVLGLITTGDISYHAAAMDGNLVEVSHVDYDYNNILWLLYSKTEITAHGYSQADLDRIAPEESTEVAGN